MTWLNSFISTPAIGIRIVPNYKAAFKYCESLVTEISNNYKGKKIRLSQQNPLSFNLECDGFNYTIAPDNIVSDFKYVLREVHKVGNFPSYENDNVIPYTDLMTKCISTIELVWATINSIDKHKLVRYGVVANCDLDKNDMPPGLQIFFDNFKNLWPMGVSGIEGNITSILFENDYYIDKCHHFIKMSDNTEEEVFSVKLDWFRVLKEPKEMSSGNFGSNLSEITDKASQYFECFGSGGLLNE